MCSHRLGYCIHIMTSQRHEEEEEEGVPSPGEETVPLDSGSALNEHEHTTKDTSVAHSDGSKEQPSDDAEEDRKNDNEEEEEEEEEDAVLQEVCP